MAILICPKCGEMCREYDMFCHKCGTPMTKPGGCDGNCGNCVYDTPFGCTKPEGEMPFVSPYPHSIVESGGKYVMVEDADRRSRAAAAALALLPTGALGIHNFYSRQPVLGIIHLLLLVIGIAARFVSFGSAFLASWGLAVVSAVLVLTRVIKNDGKGFPFS